MKKNLLWEYLNITVISHDVGHAIGLPHSSRYGIVYHNVWDVTGDTWDNCSASTSPTYGCLGQHINAYHKDVLGWIPAAQKFTLPTTPK